MPLLDQKILSEYKEKYNPDGSFTRDMQMYLLQMLKDFDLICKKHNIEYWISGGTCLGAVRHGGFIPWDDDVDVEMTRQNYNKLKKAMKGESEYVLQTYFSDPFYPHTFGKFRDKKTTHIETGGTGYNYKYKGIFIDVIVVEHSYKLLSKLIFGGVSLQLKLLSCKRMSLTRKIPFFLIKGLTILSERLFRVLPQRLSGSHFGYMYGCPWYRNHLNKDAIQPLGTIKFEDAELPCVKDTNTYLTSLYGDYRTPLAPEKITLHTEKLIGLPRTNNVQ